MNIDLLNNKIVILDDKMKSSLLKLLSGKLINTKIITFSELKSNYYFNYDKEAIYYLSNKYNLLPSIAKKYIDNMYYLKDINDEKVIYLKGLMDELNSNNLLHKNELFSKYMHDKEVILFDKYIDKLYLNILSDLECNIEYIDLYKNNTSKSVYECNNIEEEISFVFSSISKLIKSGININNIKIANVSSEYYYVIKKYSDIFHIVVDLDSDSSINGTHLVKLFKDNYSSDINKTLDIVYDNVNNEDDAYIYKKLVNVVNNYSFVSDYNLVKELIFEDIKNIKTKSIIHNNSVKVIDFLSEIVSDDDYVFLINYNEGVIPVNYKDEDYFSDKVKDSLGISTTSDLNSNELSKIRDRIFGINHLVITYSDSDISGKLYISSSYDESILKKEKFSIDYNNSNDFNKYQLVEYKDLFNKYGSVSEEFKLLNNNYDIEYRSYDNKFSDIKRKSSGLTLSYTSLENYNECAFKYYLKYILELDKFEDNFNAILGSITHRVLSICFNNDFDFNKEFDETINSLDYEFSNSELFFIGKIKDTLQKSIEIIKNQTNYTYLSNIMCEKEVIVKINDELNIKFKGYIDKIMYENVNGFNVVAIIDYKTGNDEINIDNSIYGISMQLPIYLYLINNCNLLSNVRIGGIYLQKIYSNKNDDELDNSLKLIGYTNSDENIIGVVDKTYEDSKLIRSLKVNQDGSYYYHAKLFDEDNINYLNNLVNDKISECYKNILDNKFDINPKVIGINNVGCRYCKYKDICYVKEEDKIKLPSKSNILGGEKDA